MLQFNFREAHSSGAVNTAADFPSRLELKVTEMICLKIREDTQTTPIEMITSSLEVNREEKKFFALPDNYHLLGQKTFERKTQSQQARKDGLANKGPSSFLRTSIIEFTKVDGNSTSYSMNRIKASASRRVKEDADLVLTKWKLQILGQP